MKTIEVFVSAPADVQEEQVVVERVIRSVAAEFDNTVSASHASRLRRLESEALNPAPPARDPSLPLRVCFWEHSDAGIEDRPDQMPNPGQFDLVVCLLWSRLGPPLAPKFVAPDGSVPGSSTEYEVAWVLDQARITPGFPMLQIYRNRSIPDVPLEPREARETSFRRWDAVQELFAKWQERAGEPFAESCQDYRSLEEFEALFRAQFRLFLAERAKRETVWQAAQPVSSSSSPFRGLYPFDYRHATLFHGRTRATREVLELLKKQVVAKRPFVLVMGPAGSGKSSLVRAGVLPLVIRAGVAGCYGPWRRAVTRPGIVGTDASPLDALIAMVAEPAPAPGTDASPLPKTSDQLVSELHQNPGAIAQRVVRMLDDISLDRLDRRLDQQERDFARTGRRESAELAARPRLTELGVKPHLALVVDQFEELFTAGFPLEVQRQYIAALVALARTRRVLVIATLASDFYGVCQQFPELIEITTPSGRYELQPPTTEEVGQIVRWRAETRGLRFEQHARTAQALDDFIIQAALASPDELPQLEHLLTRLHERQAERSDGLIRWSDYAELGGFEGALAQHAEEVFASLEPPEQAVSDYVLQQLAATAGGNQGGTVWARSVSARELVSTRVGGNKRPASVKAFVDAFLKEGFLRTDKDPRGETLVTVSHDVLLRKWPRARSLALVNRAFQSQTQAELADDHRRAAPVLTSPPSDPHDSKVGVPVVRPKPQAPPKRWQNPFAPALRKLKALSRSAAGAGARTARFVATLVPVMALLAAIIFTVHLWLKKQAEEEARRKRADEALAAAMEPLRHQESPAPARAAAPETATASPAPTAENPDKLLPNVPLTAGVTKQAPSQGNDTPGPTPNDGERHLVAAPSPPPTPAPSPPGTNGSGEIARNGVTPNMPAPAPESAPLIPELTARKQTSVAPKTPEAGASPGSRALADQSERAASPSPTQPAHPDAKALNSELSYSRAPLSQEDAEKEAGTNSSAPSPEDSSKRNRWARRTMPAPNQTWAPPAPSPASTPPAPTPSVPVAPPQTDQNTAAADEARLRALARDYIQSVENNDASVLERFYADQVNFYGQGSIGRAQVQDSTQRYHQVWPVRKWTAEGKPRIIGPTSSNMYQILQPFRWMVSNGFQSRKGDATLQLLVEKNANGEFRIVAVRQLSR